MLLFGLTISWWLATTGFVMAMCRAAAAGDYVRVGG